jgi:carboxyl-terminal processing protease
MPGSPSNKAGLKPGDQLLAIGDYSLSDPRLSLDSIRILVRGPVGSTANLTIRRNGKMIGVSIPRSEIINPAVAASYLIDDTTGLIKLTRFSEKSYRETMIALEALKEKGMRALILDLRGNGGGFLHEAVELADEFLSEDRLIVYTEGAHQKKRSFACKRPGLFETGQLTILIDEFSASASEVLAGALQDWCRAKIIGRRSFGKGLVQEQYALSNQGAIRLTVARYYTPLGRCIQRPYREDRGAYLNEILNNHDQPDSIHNKTSRIFLNPCGDSLYAGGGIQPDLCVSSDNQSHPTIGKNILQDPELIQWAYRLKNEYHTSIDTLKNIQALPMLIPMDRIKRLIAEQAAINSSELGSLTESDWSAIAERMYALVLRFRFGSNEFYRYLAAQDPCIQAARSISR